MVTPHHLPKKRGALKKHPKIYFLRAPRFSWSFTGISGYFPFKGCFIGLYTSICSHFFHASKEEDGYWDIDWYGENHRSKPTANHISMHSEGTKSLGEAGHHENRGIMAAIEDLQHSQAAI